MPLLILLAGIIALVVWRKRKKKARLQEQYDQILRAPIDYSTPQGMTNACISDGFCSVQQRAYFDQCFTTCLQNIAPYEVIQYCFVGLFNYEGLTKHAGNTAFVVTNYRLMMSRMDGKHQKFINTQLDKPPTYVKDRFFGVITIPIANQMIPIGVDLRKSDTVFNALMHTVFNDKVKRRK